MWPFNNTPKTEVVPRKQVLHPVSFRSFYAGAIDRLTQSFKGDCLSVNESLKRDLPKMRHRSRELVNDNDYGKKFINMVKTNVIGSKGIRLQAKAKGQNGELDTMDNDAIESAWKDFCNMKNCSVSRNLNMMDIQRVVMSSVAMDGEAFIRIVKHRKFKYGLALQLIEADRVDGELNKSSVNGGSKIVMGIELDEFDAPVAYYFLVKHPSETTVTFGNKKYERLMADEVIHLFVPERIAQARGIPWMHASIRRLNMVGGYEEAELVGARAGASKMGFYYTETGIEYTGDDQDVSGNLIQNAEPGTFEQLPNNVRFEAYDPQHPTGAYNYFLKGVLKGAAAGLNVSYTGYTGDLEAVNYSSIRAGLIEERENWRLVQGWFIEHCMARIYDAWVSGALTRGLIVNQAGVKLPLSKKEKFLDVSWQARGWAWVDPLKDQQANDAAVKAGHRTNSSIVAATGEDLEEVYQQLAYEKKLAEKYGLDFNTSLVSDNTDGKKDNNTKDNNANDNKDSNKKN